MKGTKENLKKQNGITLIILVITIAILLIIVGTTVYYSSDKFEINDFKKMESDINLLNDEILNYYAQYQGLPLLRDSNNEPIKYTYTQIESDSEYYIIDLTALKVSNLNYGIDGFTNPNTSEDVYVIEKDNYSIYYVKGIKVQDNIYHISERKSEIIDNSHLTYPKINIFDGEKNEDGEYISSVIIEFIPGIHKSKTVTTTYSIKELNPENDEIQNTVASGNIEELENNLYTINSTGKYKIILTSTAGNEEKSDEFIINSIYEEN